MSNKNDKVGILFINLSKIEGKPFDGTNQEGFVESVFSGTGINIPILDELRHSQLTVSWKDLKTGDIAIYSKDDTFVMGVVMGEIERQFCYADPDTSTVKIEDFYEVVNGYQYINGKRVLSVE